MLRRLALIPAAALVVFVGCSDDTDDTTGTGGSGGDATTSSGGMTSSSSSSGGMGGDPGDTTPPTVTITDDVADATATGDVTFTFTFSEDIGSSFTESDISVTGAPTGTFTAVDGTTATLVVSPAPGTAGTIELTVAAGTFEDASGNTNADQATAAQDYDVPPLTTVLFDMEGSPTLTGFGDIGSSIVTDPTDATNQVAQLDKPVTAPLWAGNTFSYCANFGTSVLPFAAGTTTITARVWSPDANIPIRLKVEDSTDPGISVETEAMVTTASTWETLTFDLSLEASGTAAINFGATYDKISIFPNFGTDGATAGAKTYYVDDITFVGAEFMKDCPAIPIDLRPDGGDAWIGWDGGNYTVFDVAAGGAQCGQAAAGASYIMPFQLPAIPNGGFTEANLQIYVIAVAGDGSLVNLHGDLYGLPFRSANDVTTNGLLQPVTMFHADTNVDATATLLADDFLTSATAPTAFLDTDMAGDAALVAYLNAQVANGAVAGDYVYLRISPDAPAPIGGGYNWVVGAAIDANAPADRPTLTVK